MKTGMMHRKFKADQIFTGEGMAPAGYVLITNEEGVIIDLIPGEDAGENIEYAGHLLTPGFINAHCHLELSHLINQVPPGKGLINFLLEVVGKRDFKQEVIQEAIQRADKEMYDAGIVAVGDISNTSDTVETKKHSRIAWTNFIEVLSFSDEKAAEKLKDYGEVLKKFRSLEENVQGIDPLYRSNLVPHAPYSISPLSFQMINEATAGQVISIHNQETPDEDELYKTGKGDFIRFFSFFGPAVSPFPVTGKTSLRSILPFFTKGQTILLIHNTFMPEEDRVFAEAYAADNGLEIVYCFCPNANLYIENTLPPVRQFLAEKRNIVLGTDSLSSNYQLSIAEEIRTLRNHFPDIPLEKMLEWATLNGAKALKRDDTLGSFSKGKKPGIISLDKDLKPKRLL
jgi:cytosine/adenosine deaminase-related metal-dependent hydrolase